MKALKDDEDARITHVYTVRPFMRTCSTGLVDGAECLRCLDEQLHGSVICVSFGSSGGTLTGKHV